MSSAILTVMQNALLDIGVSPPSTLITVSDPVTLQIRSNIYAESRYLRSRSLWPQCKKTATITLVSGQTLYPLPRDYWCANLDTQWDSSNQWRLNGPSSNADFTNRLYGEGEPGISYAYRIFGPDGNLYTAGGQFQINPAPSSSGGVLKFEYYTANLFLPTQWLPSEAGITTASWRTANGNIYDCTAITTGVTGTTPPSVTTGTQVDGGVTWTAFTTGPYETIITDTDTSIFDDDLMAAGIKWRYKRAKGLDYSIEVDEYKSILQTSVTRWNGSYRGSMTRGGRFLPSYSTQYGNWSF